MWHLVKSELVRYRGLTLASAVGHLLLLGSVSTTANLFEPSVGKDMVGFLVYSVAGLAFGLHQIGAYRRPHLWAFLIHRPMAPGRIFISLASAAALVFLAAVALPIVAATALLDWTVVPRIGFPQYLAAPFVFGLVASFYLAGCFVRLSPRRTAFCVLAVPVLLDTRQGEGLAIFIPQLVALAWLGYLAWAAFKPSLSSPLRRPGAFALAALPVQYVLFGCLVFAGLLAYSTKVAVEEHGWGGLALHAWDDYFAEGTYDRTTYLRADEAMAYGLSLAGSERSRPGAAGSGADIVEVPVRRRSRIYELSPLTSGDLGAISVDLIDGVLRLRKPAEPAADVPLPGEAENLSRALAAELDDGYLLYFLFGAASARGHHEARQVVAELGADGRYEVVSDRALEQGPPAWVRHRGVLVSPLLQHFHDLAWTAVEPRRQGRIDLRDVVSHPPPPSVLGWALAVAALSAVLTWWGARRRGLEHARRWRWTAAAFLTGLPGFLSFLVLTPPANRHHQNR